MPDQAKDPEQKAKLFSLYLRPWTLFDHTADEECLQMHLLLESARCDLGTFADRFLFADGHAEGRRARDGARAPAARTDAQSRARTAQ